MTGKTHLACGIAAATFLCTNTADAALLVLGSLLPDIDNSKSMLGRYVPFIHRIFGHRTLTHSFIFLVMLYFINPFLAVGGLVHIILDVMTAGGCPLFYPFGKRFRMSGRIVTGGLFEGFVFFISLCLILYHIGVFVVTGILSDDHLY